MKEPPVPPHKMRPRESQQVRTVQPGKTVQSGSSGQHGQSGQPGQYGQPGRQDRNRHGSRMSADKLRRIERRKARNRAVWMAVFVLAIMFLTVVMIITIMQRTRPKPRFQFIQKGEISHTVRSKGLILRDEQIFSAPTAGTLKALATEGSRAAKGQKVALIIPSNRESQLTELQKVEKDIVDLQNELMNSGKGAGAKAIFDESRAQLATLVNLVRSDVNRSDLASLHAYKTSIEVVMDQRNTRLLSIDFKDARLEQLKATKSTLEKTLGLAAGTLVCQKPGIISFRLDGQEQTLSTDLAKSLTFNDFKSYRDSAAAQLTGITTVKSGQPVLRITSSLSQALCFEITNAGPDKFVAGQYYDLTIPQDGVTVSNCRVIRSEKQDDNLFVIFQTDRKVEWLSDRRTFEAELTISKTSGMKVLLSSIRNLDPESRVGQLMIVDGGYTRLCQIQVIDKDREYAIIEALKGQTYQPQVSTVMVLNPNAIEEGEFIGN